MESTLKVVWIFLFLGTFPFISITKSDSLNSYYFNHLQSQILADPTNETCTSENPFEDINNCTLYWQCFNVNNQWYLIEFACAVGGHYDPPSGSCVLGECEDVNIEAITTSSSSVEPTTTTEAITTELPTTTTVGITTEPPTPTTEAITTEPPTNTTEVITTEPPTTEVTTSELTTTTKSTTSEPITSESTTQELTTTEESTTEIPNTSTTSSGTTTLPVPQLNCSANGNYPYPNDPTKYYKCIEIAGIWYTYTFTCPKSSCYDSILKLCVIGSCPATTTLAPSTTTVAITTISPETCTTVGTFANPVNCTMYYKCALIGEKLYKYDFTCPANSYFYTGLNICTVGTCPTTSTPNPTTTQGLTTTAPTTPSTGPTTPSTSPTTTTTGPTTIPPASCTMAGTFANPVKCTMYYKCVSIGGTLIKYDFTCPANSYFYTGLNLCIPGTCPTTSTPNPTTTQGLTTTGPTTTSSGPTTPSTDLTTPSSGPTTPSTDLTTPSSGPTTPSTGLTTPSSGPTTPSTDLTTPSSGPTTPSTDLTTPSSGPTTPSTDPTTTIIAPAPAQKSFKCTSPGYYSDTCNVYYQCVQSEANWNIYVFNCQLDSYFSLIPTPGCLIGTCPSNVTSAPVEITSSPTTTPGTGSIICTAIGKFPDPLDCAKYYECESNGSGGYNDYSFTCPVNSIFYATTNTCITGTCDLST